MGLDLGFLDNRYTVSMAYYNRRTKDKLAYIPLPSHVGVSEYLSNNGEIQNQGFEFEVHASIINSGDFKWDVNLNGAFNKIKSLPCHIMDFCVIAKMQLKSIQVMEMKLCG